MTRTSSTTIVRITNRLQWRMAIIDLATKGESAEAVYINTFIPRRGDDQSLLAGLSDIERGIVDSWASLMPPV